MRGLKLLGWSSVVAIIITGCATAPNKIEAAAVSNTLYSDQACETLIAEATLLQSNLEDLSKKQTRAARTDIAALIIVGIPVTWLYKGNKKDEIAELKGKKIALAEVAEASDCQLPGVFTIESTPQETTTAEVEEEKGEQLSLPAP